MTRSDQSARRDLPRGAPRPPRTLHHFSARGIAFLDELYEGGRISSVEWDALRQAIAPFDPQTLEPLTEVRVTDPSRPLPPAR